MKYDHIVLGAGSAGASGPEPAMSAGELRLQSTDLNVQPLLDYRYRKTSSTAAACARRSAGRQTV